MSESIDSYTARLRQHAEKLAADHARRQDIEPKRLAPPKLDYVAILKAWWQTMPPTGRQHPWSLEVVASAAFTGQPRRPALRRVAEALRTLAFTERRDWTRRGRNRRLWYPPNETV